MLDYIICIAVVAVGVLIGMLASNYITYKMMGSKKFTKRIMKRYMKQAAKVAKQLEDLYS